MEHNRLKNLLQASVFTLLTFVVVILGYYVTKGIPNLNRIFVLCGGQLPGGIIQLFIYLAFYWSIFEIIGFKQNIKEEKKGYDLLPKLKNFPPVDDEHRVMSPEDIRNLKLELIDLHNRVNKSYLVTNLVKKACTKFRSNKSISDVIQIVSEQTSINYSKAESAQSLVRFLVWSLPSIGFIGTILGIAGALGLADRAGTEDGLNDITNALYVAFDTTLLALGLSIVVMWLYNELQQEEEILHSNMEEFVIENIINRIVLD